MKQIFIIIVIIFAFGSLAPAQNNKFDQLKQDLIKVHQQITKAFNQADKSMADRLIADDYIVTNQKGGRFGKADVLKLVPEPKAVGNLKVYEELSDIQVKDYGKIALLNFVNNVVIHLGEQTIDQCYRSTEIYQYQGDRWQIVASQSTTIFDFSSLQ